MTRWLMKIISDFVFWNNHDVYKKHEVLFGDPWSDNFPYQLLKLVQQAQRCEEFDTEPEISVSAEMHEKLVYPLTLQQAQMIGSTDYIVEQDMIYSRLASNWIFDGCFCARIIVNIDYVDSKKGLDLHFHDVALTVKCNTVEVVSVEYD